jgi:hypothetical protein
MATLQCSIGDFLDRFQILWVKVSRLNGHKRRVAMKRFAEMEKQLLIPENCKVAIEAISQQLLTLHMRMWDNEDEIRKVAREMPMQAEGSTAGWLDAAATDPVVGKKLLRFSQLSLTIRRDNETRHDLISQIDVLAEEHTEPKNYDSNGRLAKDVTHGKLTRTGSS